MPAVVRIAKPATMPCASAMRLPGRLQEMREDTGLSMHGLWRKCGVSRDTISRIEGCDTIPGVHGLASQAWMLVGMLEKCFGGVEDGQGGLRAHRATPRTAKRNVRTTFKTAAPE